MKQNKFKFLMSLVMLLFALSASAYNFMVDGIAYDINGNEATVTYTDNSNYYSSNYSGLSGELVIPVSVTYNGEIYSVTTIGDYAFYGCTSLTSVTIPNSVTSIGNLAFYYCRGLTNITIPNSVTSIGRLAFYDCDLLTNIDIPNSVTSIGDYAFDTCIRLTSVTIPNSVVSIGNYAFRFCSMISVTIPNSVTSIGDGIFSGCPLTSITVENKNPNYDSRNNCNAIIETTSNTLIAGCRSTVIPNSVTSIGNDAFRFCGMISMTIPNSVTSIGDYAFYGCGNLTSITIPNSVTSIGNYAFYDSPNLTNVAIGNSVTSIGDRAFMNCGKLKRLLYDAFNSSIGEGSFGYVNLSHLQLGEQVEHIPTSLPTFSMYGKTLVIPNSVKAIKARAFYGSCEAVVIGDNIESIDAGAFSSGISVAYVSSTTPLPCANGAFANPQTLYVPAGCKGKYLMSDGWCEFADIVEGSYIRVTDLALDVDCATMQKQETLKLNATVLPADHSAASLDWWSTNTAVATVNFTGLVTTVSIGEADIYCGVDNKTVVCHITVVENHIADSIQLNYTDLLLDWDNIVDLTATVLPENVDQSVTWTIPENDNIYARVVGNKLRVMAMRSGTVTVTATSVADPSVSADCVITIQIPDVNGDTSLNIADVTALIDYLLGGNPESINIGDADVNRDGNINIADVTTLIDKLLSGN